MECDDKYTFQRALKEAGGKLVVVDFHATWCGPCKAIAPLYKQLSEKYAKTCVFLKVDVDKNQEVAQESGVKAMPSFGFFHNGQLLELLQGGQGLEAKIAALSEKHSKPAAPSGFATPGYSLLGGAAKPAAAPIPAAGQQQAASRRNPWADPNFVPKSTGVLSVQEKLEREKKMQATAKKGTSSSSSSSSFPSSASSSTATASSSSSSSRPTPSASVSSGSSSSPAPSTLPAASAPAPTPEEAAAAATTFALLMAAALQNQPSLATTTNSTSTTSASLPSTAPSSDESSSSAAASASTPATTEVPASASETTFHLGETASGSSPAQGESAESKTSLSEGVVSAPAAQVDANLLKQLMEFGFSEIRGTRALAGTENRSLDSALGWLQEHEQDVDIDLPFDVAPLAVPASTSRPPQAVPAAAAAVSSGHSDVLMDDDAELDPEMAAIVAAAKRGRGAGGDLMPEGVTEQERKKIHEMTSEEKQQWLADRRKLVKEKQSQKALEKEKDSHKSRIEIGKAQSKAREAQEARAAELAAAAIAKKKREEAASKAHRKEILAKIEADKERRRKEQAEQLALIAAAKAAKEKGGH